MKYFKLLMMAFLVVWSPVLLSQEVVLGTDKDRAIGILQNLAETAAVSDAQELVDQWLEDLRQEFGPEHPVLLYASYASGRLFFNTGNFARARRHFEQEVKLSTKILGAEHPDTLAAVKNLVETLRAQENPSGARQRFEHVVEVLTRIFSAAHPDTLTAVANPSATLNSQRDLSGGRPREEEAVGVRTRIHGAEPGTSTAIQNPASRLKETCDVSGAQHLIEEVVEFRKKNRGPLPGTSDEAESLFFLGQIYQDAGQLEAARTMFLGALEALEDQAANFDLSEEAKSQFRVDMQIAYKTAFEVALGTKHRDEAFHVLERYRAQSLLTLLRQSQPRVVAMSAKHQSLVRYYDLLTLQLASLDPQADREERARLLAEQAQVRRQLEVLRAERVRELGESSFLHPLQVEEIRHQLDPGTAMLAYYVTPDRIHFFIVTRESPLEVLQLPVTAADLWLQVRSFLSLVRTVDVIRPRSPSLEETVEKPDATARLEKGRWLFEHLIAPAFDHIKDAKRLLILPDGPLYYLPFAAFVRPTTDDPRGWQYLVEWKPLDTVQSATVYAELRKRRPSDGPSATPQRTLVALGDPSYPQSVQSADTRDAIVRSAKDRGYFTGLTRLPYSRHEVEKIGHLFEHPRIYLDTDATEERAKAEISQADYVHFASHGFADPERPYDSFLALTIPEGLPEDRENGLLQAWEIIDHVHLDADLVVLSACVTAFGPNLGGEGLMSLSRAFQIAGARTVAATLWPVADESTAELMIRFYRHLLAGTPKDEALRLAQLDFIRGPITVDTADGPIERDFTAPYYWAAFQLIGDWR